MNWYAKFSMVLLIDNTCIGNSITSDIWNGKIPTYHHPSIYLTRTLQTKKYQEGSFYLFRNIYPVQTRFTIIVTLHQHRSYCCVVHIHSGWIPPSTSLPIPCVHAAIIQIVPVSLSTKIAGSPTPFWALANLHVRRKTSGYTSFPRSVRRLYFCSTLFLHILASLRCCCGEHHIHQAMYLYWSCQSEIR